MVKLIQITVVHAGICQLTYEYNSHDERDRDIIFKMSQVIEDLQCSCSNCQHNTEHPANSTDPTWYECTIDGHFIESVQPCKHYERKISYANE